MLLNTTFVSLPVFAASGTSPYSACIQSELNSANVGSLASIAKQNPTFEEWAANGTYVFQALGIQAGSACSPILMFNEANGESIEVIFSTTNSVVQVIRSAASNVHAGADESAVWSGYQSNSCSGSPCNSVAMTSAQVDFYVLSDSTPTQNENGNCCVDVQWVGMGDEANASDNVGIQGGTITTAAYHTGVSAYSPEFFYETGYSSGSAYYFTSSCLVVNYGDYVNVTASRGSFGAGGAYSAEIVYGDNDPSSTCAVYYFFSGSSYTFSPYWSYSEMETPEIPGAYGCTYSEFGLSDICQTVSFSTNTVAFGNYYSGYGWTGFATTPSGSGYTVDEFGTYLYQGTQDTSVAINSGSYIHYTNTYDSSQQG